MIADTQLTLKCYAFESGDFLSTSWIKSLSLQVLPFGIQKSSYEHNSRELVTEKGLCLSATRRLSGLHHQFPHKNQHLSLRICILYT